MTEKSDFFSTLNKYKIKTELYIQGESKQPIVLKISYSWRNSETIFPLSKFCSKLSF